MTVRDLRDVLREHGDAAPPPNPARHDQVRARIGRIRLRRRLMAAGTAAAAVVAVLGVVVVPGGPDQRGDTTVAVAPAATSAAPEGTPTPKLPETFTAPDGTVYRRLALTSIGMTGSRKATVTVPVTGKPLDVAGVCTPQGEANPGVQIRVDGRPTGRSGLSCRRGFPHQLQLQAMVLPAGADRVTITFDTTTHGWGCTRPDPKGACRQVKEFRVPWSLAVYEWTPPDPPAEPAALRPLPRKSAGWKLADTRSGTWPAEKSLTFRVRGDGRPVGLDPVCTGDLAGRLWFSYAIDGKSTGSSSACGVWEKGPFPMALSLFEVPKGKTVTITVTLSMQSPAEGRPVRWSVGLFRR
ncbi:hypothetical protein [Nonomuraea rhodomycinica]|uniref:Uncharacterized protein n=1 Tax=Nonomuraea rhodomycinica TaxID=1712872 RepID=A0A7Y6M8X7_9ACTN|nr:hypothetical protein [Nonomuraea rhodomycinica]NUW39047.1 hypothetical protein [Nonomuraea rhodomycinica]